MIVRFERFGRGTGADGDARRRRAGALRWMALGAAAFALAGCRAEEQDRPAAFVPGTYLGQPDQPIDDATRKQLKDRARLQKF